MAGFKYIIQTELQLNMASINKLLNQVSLLDKQIQNRSQLNINARLSNNSRVAIQREIGSIKASIPVAIKLDQASVAQFKRDMDTLVANAKREIQASVNNNNSVAGRPLPQSVTRPTIQNTRATGGMERLPMVGQATSGMTEREIREYNAHSRRISVLNKELEASVKAQIAEENKKLVIKRQATQDENLRAATERANAAADRARTTELNNQLKQQRIQRNLERLQNPNKTGDVHRDILMDPDAPIQAKRKSLQTLDIANANTSRATGAPSTASFNYRMRDPLTGAITQVRTLTREYDGLGNAMNRADKTLNQMMQNQSKHFLFHTAIAAGFYKITESVLASIEAMRDFEAEMIKIDILNTSRNKEAVETAASVGGPVKSFSNVQSQKDIFDLAKRYGRDPMKDVMPFYTEMLRRSDLAPDQQSVRDITQLVLRGGIVARGSEADSQVFNSMGSDIMGILQSMNGTWKRNGKNPTKELNDFIDDLAVMKNNGADIEVVIDALGNSLVPFSNGQQGNMPLTSLAALAGSAKKAMGDAGGSEIATTMRMMLVNLQKQYGRAKDASDILGFRDMPDAPLEYKLEAMAQRKVYTGLDAEGKPTFGADLTEGQLKQVANSLGSSSGGGAAMAPKISQVIESMAGDYMKYSNTDGNSKGAAEKVAVKNTETLTGQLGKFNAAFKELSVTLGAAGVLDALKGFVKALTVIVEVTNSFVSGLALLNQKMHEVFGESVGTAINSMVTLGAVFAGAGAAKKMLFKNQGAGSIVGAFGGDLISSVLTGGNNAPNARPNPVASAAGAGARTRGVGGVVMNLLGVNGLRGMFSRGAATGGAEVATRSFGSVLTKVLPVLGRFALLLTRLSLWGAALGLVAWGVKAIWEKHKENIAQGASVASKSLAKPEVRNNLAEGFAELVKMRNDPRFKSDLGYYVDYQNKAQALRKEVNTDENGKYSSKTKGLSVYDNYAKLNLEGPTGDVIEYKFKTDASGLEELEQVLGSINEGISVGEFIYSQQNKQLLDQYELMSKIKKLSDTMQKRGDYADLATKMNSLNFAGATDSLSYYKNSMGIINNTIGGLEEDFSEVASQRALLAKQSKQNEDFVNVQAMANPALFDEIDKKLQQALPEGAEGLANFLKQYNPDGKTKEEKDSYTIAKGMYDKEMSTINLEDVNQSHKNIVDTLTTEIAKYKELYTAYLVASSGVNIMDGAMKRLDAQGSYSKMQATFAIGNTNKLQAQADVYGNMAKQSRLYSNELGGLKSAMDSIAISHPDQDFSMEALYNPSDTGLTGEQNAFKQMLERQGEVTSNYNQSLESLRQQADAMVDLVMSTTKYKSMWDSVNDRIELSKNLQGQIRDLQTEAAIQPMVDNLKRQLFGKGFDSGASRAQGAEQRRDAYIDSYQQVQKAIYTYGDDARKLKEAIGSISGKLSEQLDAALIDPLANIVDTGFAPAAQKQMEASTMFESSVKVLESILSSAAEAAGIAKTGTFTEEQKKQLDAEYFKNLAPQFIPYAKQSMASTYGSQDAMYTYMQNSLNSKKEKTKGDGAYDDIINRASAKYGVDADLIRAVIKQESGFDTTAVSPAGAAGLMQLMPGTAKGLGVTDSFDPEQNIMGGTKHLNGLLAKYDGNLYNALSAYNWGGGNMDKYLAGTKKTMPKETQNYAPKVLGYYDSFDGVNGNIPAVSNKGVEAKADNEAALAAIQAEAIKLQVGALKEQVNYLSANSIKFKFNDDVRQAGISSRFSRSAVDYQTSYYDSVRSARVDVANKKAENDSTLGAFQATLKAGGLPPEIKSVYQDLVKELQANSKALDKLEKEYAKQAYNDPRYNSATARTKIDARLGDLDKIYTGKNKADGIGGVEWYKIIEDINRMFSEYGSKRKNMEASQTLFNNTGKYYDRTVAAKEAFRKEDVTLVEKQLSAVNTMLGKVAQGTNKWYTILEDAVSLQEKIMEMENKKTELAKKYFEMTSKGVYAYINARAYTQSRDYVNAKSNKEASVSKWNNAKTQLDPTEQLVNLQIISESHDKMIQIMNDYRGAVVGAFKAGALSMGEYLEKLNNLRDMQNEIKENAITMVDTMQGSFSSNLSSAIKEGMQGSFDAPENFIKNMKDSMAGAVSSQMSNIVLQQSGLQDVMNGLISSMVGSMTTSDPNKSVNAFNLNDFKGQIDSALAPFLPLIEQISNSTDGIFGVLKDQLYNAPGGFKIDDYIYEIEKAKSPSDLGKWWTDKATNEAGSPTFSGNTSGGAIVLPPMANIPTGVPSTITKPIEPVLISNSVEELLSGLATMKDIYGDKGGDVGDKEAKAQADKIREQLKKLAPEVAKTIGDGTSGMNAKELTEYLQNTDLSQYDVVAGIGTTNSQLQGVIDGVGIVASNILSLRSGSSSSGSSSSGSSSSSSSSSTGSVSSAMDRMQANSDAWKTASSQAERDRIAAENKKIGEAAGYTRNESTGVWYDKNGKRVYHTGGIANAMNFANGSKLKSNEFQAILQNDETIFQKGQLGSFLGHFFETGGRSNGGSGGGTNVNVSVNVSGAGADESLYEEAIARAVTQAVYEVQRQGRLSNLRNKGVAY